MENQQNINDIFEQKLDKVYSNIEFRIESMVEGLVNQKLQKITIEIINKLAEDKLINEIIEKNVIKVFNNYDLYDLVYKTIEEKGHIKSYVEQLKYYILNSSLKKDKLIFDMLNQNIPIKQIAKIHNVSQYKINKIQKLHKLINEAV